MYSLSKRTLFVFLLALVLYLPFNSYIPVTDPVESNYALTAKEMLLSGDWLSPRIYGQFWYDKPVMIYWLIAFSYKIFGITEFAARFPAALFSAGSVAFIYWFGNRLFRDDKVGLFSAIALATSFEYWLLARMIITDAVLFFFTSFSLSTFYLGLLNGKKGWYIAAYGTAGLAVLTKGPIGLLLPGLIIFSYIIITRRWALLTRLFLIPGIICFLLVGGPWYWLMYHVHGSQFIDTFLGLHNYLRATISEHPRDNVFYYYLVLFPISILPWTGLAIKSLMSVSLRKSTKHFSFLITWSAVIIVFYSFMATKYPTYVFPAVFPVSLLTGLCMKDLLRTRQRKPWLWLSTPLLLLILIGIVGGKFVPSFTKSIELYSVSFLCMATLFWFQIKGNVTHLPIVSGLIIAVLSMSIIDCELVPLAETRSARHIVTSISNHATIVASYGDYSTSAVYYSGYIIPRLIENQESDKKESIWSGKYTMPTMPMETFERISENNAQSFVIVKVNNLSQWQATSLVNSFTSVAQQGNMILYRRNSTP